MNYVDRKMFVLFCVSIWVFALANLVGAVYLCYRADCPVESISQDNFDFKVLIEANVKREYRNAFQEIDMVHVEWSADGVEAYYQGRIKGTSYGEVMERTFYGRLRKFNTGWKVITSHEDR